MEKIRDFYNGFKFFYSSIFSFDIDYQVLGIIFAGILPLVVLLITVQVFN